MKEIDLSKPTETWLKIEDYGFLWDNESSRVGYLPYDDDNEPTYKGWYKVERDYTIYLTTDGDLLVSSEHNPNHWMKVPKDLLLVVASFIKQSKERRL